MLSVFKPINIKQKQPAFTLVEILLTIALLSVIVFIALPFSTQSLERNELDQAFNIVLDALRNAEASAKAGFNDSDWGVHLTSGNIVVFKGNSYTARDTAYDIATSLSSKVAVSGPADMVFYRVSGLPSITGSYTISGYGSTRQININDKGTLLY